MHFSTAFAQLLGLSVVAATPAKRQSSFEYHGVNIVGGNDSPDKLPGEVNKDYEWPGHFGIQELKKDGLNTFRISFLMERLVPDSLTGPINQTFLDGMLADAVFPVTSDSTAVLSPYNFGRYYGEVITDVEAFKTFWATVAYPVRKYDGIVFDTMHQFHDMPDSLVAELNQAAIDGIRSTGAKQPIWVEGNNWSKVDTFVSSGGAELLKGLADPEDKLVYAFRNFVDNNGDGTAQLCPKSKGDLFIRETTAWLKENKKRGVLAELGGYPNFLCSDNVEGILSYARENKDVWAGWLWWAAGPRLGTHPYSIWPGGYARTHYMIRLEKYF